MFEKTKQSLEEYIEKMNRYNEFDLAYLKSLSVEKKLDMFFDLMRLAYKMYSKKEIERFQTEKTEHLIFVQKLFLKAKNAKFHYQKLHDN